MPEDYSYFEETKDFNLAQFNISDMRTEYDHPLFDDFKALLPASHLAADEDVDFVWRMKGEDYPGGYIQPYPDNPYLLGNLSIWRSLDALHSYTFSEPHINVMRKKRKWFMKPHKEYSVLWWTTDTRVMLKTAIQRLEFLQTEGVSPRAFTFKQPVSFKIYSQNVLDRRL